MVYDLERVLHAEQDIEIFKDIRPDAGDIRASASALLDMQGRETTNHHKIFLIFFSKMLDNPGKKWYNLSVKKIKERYKKMKDIFVII